MSARHERHDEQGQIRRVRVRLHQPPPRQRAQGPIWLRVTLAGLVAAAVVAAGVLVVLTSGSPQRPAMPDRAAVEQDQPADQITYSVTGDGVGLAWVTYVGDDVSHRPADAVRLPWTVTLPLKPGALQTVSLLAVSDGGGRRATLTCEITRNGAEAARTTAAGPDAHPACADTGS
jgi:hypothetical protein